jgi:SnoaL-like protein
MDADERSLLHRIWSVHEIRQLAYRYAYAFDSRDVPLLESLWEETDEPAAYPEMDIHTIRGEFDQWLNGLGPTVLSVTNHLVDFEGDDHARGVVYCLAQIDLGDRFVEQSVLYHDRYARRGGTWRFVTRRHMLWFGQAHDDNPFRLPPANWPASPIGRGTLPEELPSYQRFQAGDAAAEGDAAV